MNTLFYKNLKKAVLTLFLVLIANIVVAAQSAPPLLLSLDVEQPGDVKALEIINLQEPATYFVTGEFAKQSPKVVAGFLKNGTVGSHSNAHPNLTEISLDAVRADLLASKLAIEAATGKSPKWFRAPFLEKNDDVFKIALDLGFSYDSSESERWPKQQILSELPISINETGKILFSDYDIFVTYGLDDQMALDLLKENYLSRMNTKRPFVFLLHPSIIAKHTEVLHDFVKYVKQQGGECMSFDQYIDQKDAQLTKRIGIRLDPSAVDLDIKKATRDLLEMGVSDAFVFADTSNGNLEKFRLSLKTLKAAGIKTHLIVSALRNPQLISLRPELAMVDEKGRASSEWLSPTKQETIGEIVKQISELLKEYSVQGIHLVDLSYPGQNFDFSPDTIKDFETETGKTVQRGRLVEELLGAHYADWVNYRFSQIEKVVLAVSEAIGKHPDGVELSATLATGSLIDFLQMEKNGQDYHILAEYLNLVVTEPLAKEITEKGYSITHVTTMGHVQVGSKPFFIGLPRFPETSLDGETLDYILGQLSSAQHSMAGLVLPDYSYLQSSSFFSANGYEAVYSVLDSVRKPVKKEAEEVVIKAKVIADEKQTLAISTPEKSELKVAGNSNKAPIEIIKIDEVENTAEKDEFGLMPLIISLLVTLLLLGIVAYFIFYKRLFAKRQNFNMDKTTIIDWQSMDKSILNEEISGKLVHSVAKHLRTYDPISTSKYRIALLISMVTSSNEKMTMNDLMSKDIDVQGWHVLAMSHLKEAMMHGFIQVVDDYLEVTEKGTNELHVMTERGFEPGQWIFVEQRLHENLLVICPTCDTENSAHWYWANFTCSKCGKDVVFKECKTVVRKKNSEIELDQHNYA